MTIQGHGRDIVAVMKWKTHRGTGSFDITERPAELLQIGYNNRDIDITVATIVDGVMYPASVKLVAVEHTNSCPTASIGQPE